MGNADGALPVKLKTFDLDSLIEDDSLGAILEVDLDYPKKLHNYHNDYPLAPERVTITKDDLSPYCEDIREKTKKQ